MRSFPLRNQRGGALIATVIICFLLLGLTLWYFQWSLSHSKEGTHGRAVQRALEYAESGMDAAQQAIRMPGPMPPGLSQMLVNGGLEYSITADTNAPQQLEVYATGYYDLPQGAFDDPLTHSHAQRAVVRARVYFDNVDKPIIAVPGKLTVNPGSFVNDAIYASDLVFVKGNPPAHIESVFYSHSITRDDGTADTNPSYVVFSSTPVLLGYPLHFPRLGIATQAYYKKYATSIISQLSDGSTLDGLVPAPSGVDVPVYYCDGDLDIGKNDVLMPGGSFVVYVTGMLRIHNSITSSGTALIVFLVEKDIEVESAAPGTLILNGTFMTNGKITALGNPRQGSLAVNGSLLAGEGIDLAGVWTGQRTYYHRQADASLPIPHLTELMEYTVLQGKYK